MNIDFITYSGVCMIIDIYLNLFNVKRILFGVPFLGGSTLLLFYSVVCFTVYLSNHVK